MQPRVLGLVDHAHAPTTELFSDAVVRDVLADELRRSRHEAGMLRRSCRLVKKDGWLLQSPHARVGLTGVCGRCSTAPGKVSDFEIRPSRTAVDTPHRRLSMEPKLEPPSIQSAAPARREARAKRGCG